MPNATVGLEIKEELLNPTHSSSTIGLPLFTKDNGTIADLMDMAKITTLMVDISKEPSSMVCLTAMVDSSTQMEIITRDR